jgi:hypothetical protein
MRASFRGSIDFRSERVSSVCFSSGIGKPHFTGSFRSKGARAGPSCLSFSFNCRAFLLPTLVHAATPLQFILCLKPREFQKSSYFAPSQCMEGGLSKESDEPI